MSKIDPLLINNFVDANKSNAEDVAENFYYPEAARHSLEVINGHIDQYNNPPSSHPDSWRVPTELVQKNTFTGGSMVGATGNIDFFRRPNFDGVYKQTIYGPDDNTTGADRDALAEEGDWQPVPGANAELYLPYDCSLVLFTWNVHFEDDAPFRDHDSSNSISASLNADIATTGNGLNAGGRRTWLRFYLDNAWVQGQERITFPGKILPGKDGVADYRPPLGLRYHQKYWNGHHAATTLTKGWHSAGLRIFSNSTQARLRVRGIRYIYFR